VADDDDSSDESQKTEDPTPKRLEEARERGQVVSSKEINNWAVLAAATLLAGAAPVLLGNIKDTLRAVLEQAYAIPADTHGLLLVMQQVFFSVGGNALLAICFIAAAGALASFLQTGPLFTTHPITPDISKISLVKGFGRLFSLRSVMELVKGVVKLLLVTIAAWIALRPYFSGVEHFVGLDLNQTLFELRGLFVKMMIAVLSVLFFLAIADYMFQRHEFMKNMRMSKQDIKEEYRQTEGDPHVKGRLRRLREQRARQRMMQAVPEADVVITNPTHYAVALKYDTAKMDAPQMVAKGVDKTAERIREVANENNVPIVENPALARALFSAMDVDETIPKEHFKAVAEVISYVFKLKGKKV